jgi:thiol-disulfide isomerase/thioredoxin
MLYYWLFLYLVAINTNVFAQTTINFESSTWAAIKQKAQQEKKFIFLDCYTSWCKPCKVMEKEVFTNDSVADFYNTNFINVKYDMEKGIGQALNQKYAVTGYPTLLILDYRGLEVYRNLGELTTPEFIKFGKTALHPTTYRVVLQKELEKGNLNYDFIRTYLENLAIDFTDNTFLINTYWKSIKKENLTNRENWEIVSKYTYSTQALSYQTLEKEVAKYAAVYTQDSVEYVMFNIIRNDIFTLLMAANMKPEKFTPLREKIANLKHPAKENFLYLIDKDFYRENKLWVSYYELLQKEAEKRDWYSPDLLIEYASSIQQNLVDKQHLQYAEKLIKRVLEINANNILALDIAAQILLKLDKKKEALQASEKCLALAKAANEDTSLYEETHNQIKNSK